MTQKRPKGCLLPFQGAYPTACPDIRMELAHGS